MPGRRKRELVYSPTKENEAHCVKSTSKRGEKKSKACRKKSVVPKGNSQSCHQCRQSIHSSKGVGEVKSGQQRIKCSQCTRYWCENCLKNRYGMERSTLDHTSWNCAVCLHKCNCSLCRKKDGKLATGILTPLAKNAGFSNVSEFLENGTDDIAKCLQWQSPELAAETSSLSKKTKSPSLKVIPELSKLKIPSIDIIKSPKMSHDSLYRKNSYMYLQKEDLPAKRRKLHHPEYVITIEGMNEEAGWESNDTVAKDSCHGDSSSTPTNSSPDLSTCISTRRLRNRIVTCSLNSKKQNDLRVNVDHPSTSKRQTKRKQTNQKSLSCSHVSRHGNKVDDKLSGSDEILDSESPLVDKKEVLEKIRFQLMTEMKEKESQERQAVMEEKRRMKMEEKKKLCELRMKEREQRKEIRLKEREEKKESRKREIEARRKSKESKREGKRLVQDRLTKARLLLREAQKIKQLKIKEREKEKRRLEFQELVAKRQAERKKKLELFSFTNKSQDSHVIELVEDTPIQCKNDGIPSLPLFPELEVGVTSECVTSLIFVSEFLLMFSQQLGLQHKINGDSLPFLIKTSRMISKIYISLLKVIAKDDAQLNSELKGLITRATGAVTKLLNTYLHRLGQNGIIKEEELTVEQHIYILENICHIVMETESFSDELDSHINEMDIKRKELRAKQSELTKDLREEMKQLCDNGATFEVMETRKEEFIKKLEELQTSHECEDQYQMRLKPLGRDRYDRIYWKLRSFPGILVEDGEEAWRVINCQTLLNKLMESLHPAGRREGELYYSLKSLEIVKF